MAGTLADRFLALEPEQRRAVHFALCWRALQAWTRYAHAQGRIHYVESVVGTRQEVDKQLPVDAFEAAKRGVVSQQIGTRYQEPIAAMQDDDLVFPEDIEFAYYAIYNLFSKYAQGEAVGDWLIVNQALSSEKDDGMWTVLLAGALDEASRRA